MRKGFLLPMFKEKKAKAKRSDDDGDIALQQGAEAPFVIVYTSSNRFLYYESEKRMDKAKSSNDDGDEAIARGMHQDTEVPSVVRDPKVEATTLQCFVCRGQRHAYRGSCLMTCASCKQIVYCSKACQKKDWRRHKLEHVEPAQAQYIKRNEFSVQVAGALSGNSFIVEGCNSTMTVVHLKKKIVRHEDMPLSSSNARFETYEIELLIDSRTLLDKALLSEIGVAEGSCLKWIGRSYDDCPPLVSSSDED